uniref:Uncharacterized protein n=1 Tax=Oryza barthii TaxID=65489 RepID=A0A0D3GSI5_9ORYZ
MSPSSVNLRSCALTTRSTERNNGQNVKQTARTHAPTHAPARREGVSRQTGVCHLQRNPAGIELGADVYAVQGSERQFLLVLARELILICAHATNSVLVSTLYRCRSVSSNKLGREEREDVAFHGELEIDRCTSRGPRQGRRDSAVRDLLSLRVGSCIAVPVPVCDTNLCQYSVKAAPRVIDNWCHFALSFRRPYTVANRDGFINYVLPFSIASLGMPFIFSKL